MYHLRLSVKGKAFRHFRWFSSTKCDHRCVQHNSEITNLIPDGRTVVRPECLCPPLAYNHGEMSKRIFLLSPRMLQYPKIWNNRFDSHY